MKYHKFIIFLLFIYSCDLEKYTTQSHNSSPISQDAKIYGKISNIYDGQPVDGAIVTFGNQATFTDSAGNYLLYYYMNQDEERNKPVQVTVSALNFLTYYTEKTIYPENNYDFSIEYGAPVILKIARVDSYCQAIIMDYQGFDNLATIDSRFSYRHVGDKVPAIFVGHSLSGIPGDSSIIGHYQCIVKEQLPPYGFIDPSFIIKAWDRNGLYDKTSSEESGVDSLLFPILPFNQ